MPLLKRLYVQVLIGIVAGVALGIAAPGVAVKMKPLGDAFISLLRILLAPIIFLTVVHGMAGVRDIRKMGRLGVKALVYFEVVSTICVLFGFVLANVFKPGAGLHASAVAAPAAGYMATATAAAGQFTVVNFLLSIIPVTLFDAFAKGEILQVLFISILVGVALTLTAKPDSVILAAVGEAQLVVFKILSFFMRLAPIGAFGAMAAAVGANGSSTILYLIRLVVLFYAACLVFIAFGLGSIAAIAKLSLLNILRMIKEEIVMVFGTASGEVAFPRLVTKLKQAGCSEAVVGFVLPAGYSFNLDATSIYMSLAVGFIAQATDTPFSLGQQMAVLAVLMLTSKGGTTVAGGAFVKLAATLQSVRMLPLSGLGLLFGVDRLMAIALSVTNMIGNTVAVFAIARWENALDDTMFRAYLAECIAAKEQDFSPTAGESALAAPLVRGEHD